MSYIRSIDVHMIGAAWPIDETHAEDVYVIQCLSCTLREDPSISDNVNFFHPRLALMHLLLHELYGHSMEDSRGELDDAILRLEIEAAEWELEDHNAALRNLLHKATDEKRSARAQLRTAQAALGLVRAASDLTRLARKGARDEKLREKAEKADKAFGELCVRVRADHAEDSREVLMGYLECMYYNHGTALDEGDELRDQLKLKQSVIDDLTRNLDGVLAVLEKGPEGAAGWPALSTPHRVSEIVGERDCFHELLKEAAARCSLCNGAGFYRTSCSLCGDSTYDHYCDDERRACPQCDTLRIAVDLPLFQPEEPTP